MLLFGWTWECFIMKASHSFLMAKIYLLKSSSWFLVNRLEILWDLSWSDLGTFSDFWWTMRRLFHSKKSHQKQRKQIAISHQNICTSLSTVINYIRNLSSTVFSFPTFRLFGLFVVFRSVWCQSTARIIYVGNHTKTTGWY